jgi:hypothetical protein
MMKAIIPRIPPIRKKMSDFLESPVGASHRRGAERIGARGAFWAALAWLGARSAKTLFTSGKSVGLSWVAASMTGISRRLEVSQFENLMGVDATSHLPNVSAMLTAPIQGCIMRSIQVISFVVAALLAASANSQDLNGSFSTGSLGETFKLHNNLDGTADIYDEDGHRIGQAQDDGYGYWEIHSTKGRRLGEIQVQEDGSFEVNDVDGRPWGSGRKDPIAKDPTANAPKP